MEDKLLVEGKNYRMSRIRSKDTRIEKLLRSVLWRDGLRYRIHYKKVVGSPDIAFIRHKVAVFVDSEFWHGHEWGPERIRAFGDKKEYWKKKIERNMERDKEVNADLGNMGWTVLRFWGNNVMADPQECLNVVKEVLCRKDVRWQ